MSRVSNIAQDAHLQMLMREVNVRLAESRAQVITGKAAQDFSGLGSTRSLASIDLRADTARIDSLIANIDTVRPRTDTMDRVLTDIAKEARDVFAGNLSYPRSGRPPLDVIQQEAQQALQVIQANLNTSLGGRYLFASRDIGNPPYDNAAQLTANAAAEIADYMAGTDTGAQVLADMAAYAGADLGYSATLTALPAGDGVTARIDENLEVDYTVRADQGGIADVLRGLSLLANLDYDPNQDAEFWVIFEGAQALLETGAREVDTEVAALGLVQEQLTRTRVAHEESLVALEDFISDAEDVDSAEAITRMQMLQAQLEASYQTIATLRDLSLVNFLR